jgi:hypothetical protein
MTRLRSHARPTGEDGFTLVTVILLGVVMSLFLAANVAYMTFTVKSVQTDGDYHAAEAAAEAGIADYLGRLNADPNYWTKLTAPAAGADQSCWTNTDSTNKAFSAWVPLSGAPVTATGEMYRYCVNAAQGNSGRLLVTSTGLSGAQATGLHGGVTRTVQAHLALRPFTDYLWFTDHEIADPAYSYAWAGTSNVPSACTSQYAWQWPTSGNPSTYTTCSQYAIAFTAGDVLNGKVHTNDTLWINTTTGQSPASFQSAVETGCPRSTCPKGYVSKNNATATFANTGDPQSVPVTPLPQTNLQLKSYATTSTGCLFTGPTRIWLKSNGTMVVSSPYSKSTYGCDSYRNGTGGFGFKAATMPLPANGVIYVQSIPTSTGDANYSAAPNCSKYPYVDDPEGKQTSGFPLANDIGLNYGYFHCNYGDVYIDGVTAGQLTVAADNINIVGNLTYAGATGTDVLGLVANNFVQIYHPVDSNGKDLLTGTAAGTCPKINYQINASLMALSHSITAENYKNGTGCASNVLNVTGSMLQLYRGAVGTSTLNQSGQASIATGFLKNYQYDARLRHIQPPYISLLGNAGWSQDDQVETNRKYDATGTKLW